MIKVKDIVDEDFQNYRKPSMIIAMSKCDWKCCHDANIPISICQNSTLSQQPNIEVDSLELFHRYMGNPITKAVVIGGLEPMLQFADILDIIRTFRSGGCDDDIVIYTGYYMNEIPKEIEELKKFNNIIVKFGRYKPNAKCKWDDVLGVMLVSDNQYAQRIL
jgi:hypothetical protein